MTSGISLLKAVVAEASGGLDGSLPPNTLRFELEYTSRPNSDAEKAKLVALFGSDNFALFPVHKDIENILMLQFQDVRRSISRRAQFEIAAELVDGLTLCSCIPEGAPNFPVDDVGAAEAREGAFGEAILNRTCWTTAEPKWPRDWVVDNLNVRAAWKLARGAGVCIAQPDTGVAPHEAIDKILATDASLDVFTGERGKATDPLEAEMESPGHGTATSSVIACPHAHIVVGIAPEAKLVPIRCVDSVLFTLDGSLIARAIMHARDIEADIISLSLGGPFVSKSIKRAIALAVDAEMIVVAAAGNCCKFVVYPANDPNTIAIAGVRRDDNAWKGTSRGAAVDVAAPSENVFAARRSPTDKGVATVEPSQGTSFGTALTAGVAALWLSYHGRAVVRKRAAALGIPVNELFRAAVSRSSRRPATGWSDDLGAGIVDAAALLALPLDDIRPLERSVAVYADASPLDQHAQIAELAARGESVEGFDWAQHGAEAVFLSMESLQKSRPELAPLSEAAARPWPTAALAKTPLPMALRAAIDRLEEAPSVSMRAPWIGLGRGNSMFGDAMRVGGLEKMEAARARRDAFSSIVSEIGGAAGADGLQKSAERIIAALNARNDDSTAAREREEAIVAGLEACRMVRDGEDPLRLSNNLRMGIESLVRLTNRPAFKIVGDGISEDDPLFGDGGWGDLLMHQAFLAPTVKAVGRINLEGRHIGTGFVVDRGDGLVMTNRHVLEAIGEEIVSSRGSKWLFPFGTPTIDFSEAGIDGRAYEIVDVALAGPDATRGRVNFKTLDLVLLKVKKAAGFPVPLVTIKPPAQLRADTKIFVLGYPAVPGPDAYIDPSTGTRNPEIGKRLARIFGVDYGRKYLSPGVIATSSGGLGPRDPRGWVMVHDATTLGGNSGSLVVALQGNGEVAGLHFAGAPLSGNFAHDLTRVPLPDKTGLSS